MQDLTPSLLLLLLLTATALLGQTGALKDPQGCREAVWPCGIEMVYIPPGEFLMGAPRDEEGWKEGEGPVHKVFVKGIWIGKYEVTRSVWRSALGGSPLAPGEGDLPQRDVSHDDVQRFLAALRKKTGLPFRLPTEAEWEKCCRGGSHDSLYGPLDEIAWHEGNSGGSPHPVGTKRPNGYGLCDTLGNVWEWCSDWYGPSYYRESPQTNPAGPENGKRRVCRGGGFRHGGHYLRAAHRNDQNPSKSKPYLGFRLALDPYPGDTIPNSRQVG